MEIPEFDRAQYGMPESVEPAGGGVFLQALLYGVLAMLVGSVAWGIVSMDHIMVSIVAIGIGYVVARAMMTATGGFGGRQYQIAAVILTYFGCTLGDVCGIVFEIQKGGRIDMAAHWMAFAPELPAYALIGPFLSLQRSPLNGIIGLFIIFVGLRTAWRMAAGSPGFGGRGSGSQAGPFGMR
jgi:hypothetical protein